MGINQPFNGAAINPSQFDLCMTAHPNVVIKKKKKQV